MPGAVFFLAAAATAGAADRVWTGNTSVNWNTASNWSPTFVPGAADRAIIPSAPAGGRMPTISVAPPTLNQLLVNAGATLTINAGLTLQIDGGASPIINGTGTVVTLGTGRIAVIAGTSGSTLINQSITLGNFTLNAVSGSGYIVASGTTNTFNGNLVLQRGNLQLGTGAGAAVTLDVNGNVQIDPNAQAILRAPASVVRVSGDWIHRGAMNAGTGTTVIFDGAGPQTIDMELNAVPQITFENLRISNTASTVTFLDNSLASAPNGFNVAGNLTVDAAARFVVQDFAVVGNSSADVFGIGSGATVTFTQQFDPDCTISFNLDAGADDGLLVLQGPTLPPNDTSDFGFGLIPGQGTVRIQTTANGTLHLTDGGPFTFFNLEIDTDAGNGQIGTDVITAGAGFNVLNNLVLTEGQFAVGNFIVDVNGNVDSSAASASQLDFTGAGTLRVAGNVDLDSFSQVTAGTTGPFSTIQMDGTAPQTFKIRASTASQFNDLDAVRISNPTGVTVLNNPNGDFDVNGTLTIDAGCTLTVQDTYDADGPLVFSAGGGNTLRLEGDLLNDASELGSAFTPGTGTVVYAGQNLSQTVYTRINGTTPISYYHLTIDNTGAGVATQETPGVLDVNGTFTINALDSEFTATSGNMTVAQSFICNGTFNNGGFTVTMDGTGIIGGTSPALTFFNLLINGLTTDVVTAARSFTTANTFTVMQGRLTTSGAAAPITMTALLGVSAGNGAGAASTGTLELLGPATLAIGTGQTFSVNSVDGRFISRSNANGTPTVTRAAGGTFNTLLNGVVDIIGMNFSFGDAEGLDITATATITNLRRITFTDINAAAGSRHLSIAASSLEGDYPNNFFGPLAAGTFNVWVHDTTPGATPVRVRFEDRGAAPPGGGGGGPGAGETGDADDDTNDNGVIDATEPVTAAHGGAIVQWAYTINIDMTGQIQGFPMPAFDWNTFVYYSTYVLMRDAAGTTDTIFVLDANGDPKSYSFSLAGLNIVGPLFWDTEGATRVVYFGTSTGQVHKLIDTGASLVSAGAPWPFSSALLDEVASPIISDQTNIYFGGRDGATNGIYKLRIVDATMPQPFISTTTRRVGTAPAWADTLTGRKLYLATTASAGTSIIYRVDTTTWSIDASYAGGTSDIVAHINVPTTTLYVGETNGYMHALPALGTVASFGTPMAGFPFRDQASAIRGGSVLAFPGWLIYGNDAGNIYSLPPYNPLLGWVLDSTYFRFTTAGGSPIQTMPLFQGGILYASNTVGRLYVLDVRTGVVPAQNLLRTYNLGTLPLSDVSRDFNTNRIYVGTQGGRLYAIPEMADPTPGSP